MSKSTPGPWEATDDGDIRAFVPEYGCMTSLIGDGEILNPADAKLMAAAPDMIALLRETEWITNGSDEYCPVCDGERSLGHLKSCKLVALLKRIEGE